MTDLSEKIIGLWELQYSKLFDADQNVIADPLDGSSGIIQYTSAMMSVQIVPPGYNDDSSLLDYHAYFGPYSIDAEQHLITHHVKGANHPHIIGKDLVRKLVFLDDNTLSLCTEPAEDVFGDGRLLYHEAVWRRL
jgi:hypothetical protein